MRSTATVLFVRTMTAVLMTAGVPAGAHTQDPLPSAEQVLARYHRAVGAAAFAAIQSLHSTGQLSIPAAGIIGTLEIWQGRPNRTLMHATVPGFGEVHTGYTGDSGWSLDPVEGPRILTGPEALQAEDDAHFESHLRPAALVESMTVTERTTLSGHDCYMVRTLWKSGRETMDCYGIETQLLIGSVRTHHGSSGPAEAIVIYDDYREFSGALLPTRITTRIEGVEQVITLVTVDFNRVPDSAFMPPPRIRALLGG